MGAPGVCGDSLPRPSCGNYPTHQRLDRHSDSEHMLSAIGSRCSAAAAATAVAWFSG